MAVRKLKLIDEDLLLKLISNARGQPPLPQPPANPILKELHHIDAALDSTLNSSSPAHVKERQVSDLLARHETHVEKFENQNAPPPPEPASADGWLQRTVKTAPNRQQRVTQNLLEHIKQSELVSWDQSGRLIIAGNLIPDTNILDLTHTLTRNRKVTVIPRGSAEFLSALAKINTPRELIPNAFAFQTAVSAAARSRQEQRATSTPYQGGAASKKSGTKRGKAPTRKSRSRSISSENYRTPRKGSISRKKDTWEKI